MDRRILHIDMDAFFASVEQVRDPSLVGKPLIIGGTEDDIRGVVSTASYEARKYGVHSAMPIAQAKKLCPQGIFMRGSAGVYSKASKMVRAVLEEVSPKVQMASIDEAYVDVTGSQRLFGGDDAIAEFIKTEIRKRTRLPSTLAITPNKLVSKIASDEGKPDGYVRVLAGDEAAYLAPLAVRKLPGAGPRTCEVLESLGIDTLGQLARQELRFLEGHFGAQSALSLQRRAQGIHDGEVVSGGAPKSISRETTFSEDLWDWPQVEATLAYLCERCAYSLREEGLECKRVTLKVRYKDFTTKTYAKTLPLPTSLDRDIGEAIQELLPKAKARKAAIRLIGINLGELVHHQHQIDMFERESNEKWEQVLGQVDAVRDKHGFGAVHFGKALGSSKGAKREGPNPFQKDR